MIPSAALSSIDVATATPNVIKLSLREINLEKSYKNFKKVLTNFQVCAALSLLILRGNESALVIRDISITRRTHMNTEVIRSVLFTKIKEVADNINNYCVNPEKNFIRKRKLTAEKLIKGIIGMGSGNLTNEILDMFELSSSAPTSSAFVQQRCKLKPEAFETIFKSFTSEITKDVVDDIPILAVDGSDVHIATNPNDAETYYAGSNGQKGYNLIHLNALYDINSHLYTDILIQDSKSANEGKAFTEMIDRLELKKAIIIADRGYESYNNIAHIQEKGLNFLFRIKDGNGGIKQGLILPHDDIFDINISMKLTNRNTKKVRELFKDKNHYKRIDQPDKFDFLPYPIVDNETIFYEINFRIVRFPISENSYETVITNLDRDKFSIESLKKLYAKRWGIETSFRELKYTTGLLDFHSKKIMCIHQEIFARVIMYNFSEIITSNISIKTKPRKHTYKTNFTVAVHMCRKFYEGKTTASNLIEVIEKNLTPIRHDRHSKRGSTVRTFHNFFYRVA